MRMVDLKPFVLFKRVPFGGAFGEPIDRVRH
jgi:hypothetical protein